MRILLLLILFFISHVGFSQGAFFKMYGGLEYDYGHDIVQLADSGYLIAGTSGSFREGHSDAFLMKIDKYGSFEWSAPYGGAENEGANDMVLVDGVGVYLVGRSNSWSQNHDMDIYIAFVDLNGNLQWEKTLAGENWEDGVEAVKTMDNGMLLGVNRSGEQANGQDVSLLRLDVSGDTVWNLDYSLPGDDEITCIESFQDSLFVVASNRFDTITSFSMAHLMMVHEDGNVLWEDTLISASGTYTINDFFISNDTLFGIGGYEIGGTNPMDMVFYKYKIDPMNNYEVETHSIHNNSVWHGDVITNYDYSPIRRYGAYRVEASWTMPGGPDVYIGRHSYQLSWGAGVGSLDYEGYDRMYEGMPTLDGGAIMVGHTAGGEGGSSVAVFKIGPGEDYPTTAGVTEVDQLVGLDIYQTLNPSIKAYPNPASSHINVESIDVNFNSYEILSMNGAILTSGKLVDSGEISLLNLSSGIYFVKLLNEASEVKVIRFAIR